MCGRYTLRDPEAVAGAIRALGAEVATASLPQRYNTAPTQVMPVITVQENRPKLVPMHWGIVPFYSRKEARPMQLINARSETAAEKVTFKQSIQRRRCVVPADGFFEWRRNADKTKTPFFIRINGEKPFFIAGIFEDECPPFAAGYALLTTGPNELLAPIHDRMPVILSEKTARAWIEPGPISAERVHEICASYPAAEMIADPVSAIVNNARNDVPECVMLAPRPD